MKQHRGIVIGCGGIGTWLGHGLAKAFQFQAPMSALILVDGDNFEPKNQQRQHFTTYGNKAVVLRDDIKTSSQNVFLIAKASWIVSEEEAAKKTVDPEEDNTVTKITAASLIQEHDHVFCVVDNFAARKLVIDAARDIDNIDIYLGGNDEALFGSVYHYQRRDGKDVTMHPTVMHEEFVNPSDRNPGEMSCQERAALDGGTQLLAVNMAVASYLLAKAHQVIFGSDEEKQTAIERAEIYFDLAEGLSQPHDRRPELVATSASQIPQYI
jgi:hypothetical protein